MAKPNFFLNREAVAALVETEFRTSEADIDLTFDMTDAPFWFSYTSDEKTRTLRMFLQTDIYSRTDEPIEVRRQLVADKVTGEILEDEDMSSLYMLAQSLCRLIRDNDLESVYAGLDPDEAGILLTVNDGKLSWEPVSGEERPDLEFISITGDSVVTGRPYKEDVIKSLILEMRSVDVLTEAAEAGEPDAMVQLAMMYLNGDAIHDVEPDPEKSLYWYTRLAQTGQPEAMFNVGLAYAKGHGAARDFDQAADWMEKAAEAGDEDAAALAEQYRKVSENLRKANEGDTEAAAELAEFFMKHAGAMEQAGEDEDYAQSLHWARIAAQAGSGAGYYTLGLAYEHGRGVEPDESKAASFYKKGADLGHSVCMCNYAALVFSGDVPSVSKKEAFGMMLRSAELGFPRAIYNVGWCYQFGHGCTGNMQKALEWYEKAAEVMDDPEVKQRVMIFRDLAQIDPHWGEDYDGADDDDDDLPEDDLDVTETMRKNLAAAGKDCSDEAIDAMSVEEAYAAFYGDFDDEEEDEDEEA